MGSKLKEYWIAVATVEFELVEKRKKRTLKVVFNFRCSSDLSVFAIRDAAVKIAKERLAMNEPKVIEISLTAD